MPLWPDHEVASLFERGKRRLDPACDRTEGQLAILLTGDGLAKIAVGDKVHIEQNLVQLCFPKSPIPFGPVRDVKYQLLQPAVAPCHARGPLSFGRVFGESRTAQTDGPGTSISLFAESPCRDYTIEASRYEHLFVHSPPAGPPIPMIGYPRAKRDGPVETLRRRDGERVLDRHW